MKRNLLKELIDKKWLIFDKPFLITGLRGVGKTYLANMFANEFSQKIYLNPETDSQIYSLIDSNENLYDAICSYINYQIEMFSDCLIIIDELTTVKEYYDKIYNYILTLKDIKKKRNVSIGLLILSSFECKEIEDMCFTNRLYPMQFDEFLIAQNQEFYLDIIKAHYKEKKKIPSLIHDALNSLFDEYLFTGGMPDVVNEYLLLKQKDNISERIRIQKMRIISDIDNYYEKENSFLSKKIVYTLNDQLSKKNIRYKLSDLRKGISSAIAIPSISELKDNYVINYLKSSKNNLIISFTDFSQSFVFADNSEKDNRRTLCYLYSTLFEKNYNLFFIENERILVSECAMLKDNEIICFDVDGYNPKILLKHLKALYQDDVKLKIYVINDEQYTEKTDEIIYLPYYEIFLL